MIWIALCAVDQARRGLQWQRPVPKFAVRLALAVLFEFSRSGERERYDRLWRYLTGRETYDVNSHLQAQTDLRAIIQDVGAPIGEDFWMQLWGAANAAVRAEGTKVDGDR